MADQAEPYADYVATSDPGGAGDMCALTVGSLFSGIGGIDLGLERAGMRVVWQSEVDPYASKVLAKHWPTVPNLGDIKQIDWSTVERPDVVAGGFPCQPWSVAGQQLGVDDERHLWPEFARCLRDLRPNVALLENVPGLLVGGLGDVLGDLAEIGFDAEWTCIPAAAVGAPHLRWRVFIVAYAQGERDEEQPEGSDAAALVGAGTGAGRGTQSGDPASGVQVVGRAASGGPQDVADADSPGPQGHRGPVERPRELFAAESGVLGHSDGASTYTLTSPSGSWRAVSESGWWSVEPDVGRMADGVPSRVDRLRCLGNAVVPQVAEYVGRQLVAAHNAQEAVA